MNKYYEIYANRKDNGNQIDQGFDDVAKFKKTLASINTTGLWCGVEVVEVVGGPAESFKEARQ